MAGDRLANMSIRTTEPYIPGLLMIREAKPVLATLKLLKKDFDLLLIDGHGCCILEGVSGLLPWAGY